MHSIMKQKSFEKKKVTLFLSEIVTKSEAEKPDHQGREA